MEGNNSIKCPRCGSDINVTDVLYKQMQDQIQNDFANKEQDFEIKMADLKRQEDDFEARLKKDVQEKVVAERENYRHEIQSQMEGAIRTKDEELKQKSEELKELNRIKADLERVNREKDELRDKMELEKEKAINEKLNEIKINAGKEADERNELRIRELEKQLEDQRRLAEEMKRRVEQGSTQLQGEIQEIVIEEMLKELYPSDTIEEVGKGQRGGDILQTVITNHGVVCGKIYYESKRTKNFSNSWIEKLRKDNLDITADILVIVTQAMPKESDILTNIDNVWICNFNAIRWVSSILRDGLVRVHDESMKHENKGTKMEILYNYLTSVEFKGQFEVIINGFESIAKGYTDERHKMEAIWGEREKQLHIILDNMMRFYGSLKGIAGDSIPRMKMLENEGGD